MVIFVLGMSTSRDSWNAIFAFKSLLIELKQVVYVEFLYLAAKSEIQIQRQPLWNVWEHRATAQSDDMLKYIKCQLSLNFLATEYL